MAIPRRTGEDRAKSLLRTRFGREIRWIEPGLGATQGLPDCFINIGSGKVIWIELKEALSDKDFSYKLRASQARVIPRMIFEGAYVIIMVGKPSIYDHFALWGTDGIPRHVFKLDTKERLLEVMKMAVGESDGQKEEA